MSWSLTQSVILPRILWLFRLPASSVFFFLNDRAPPEISPLPLPAALPIYIRLPPLRRIRTEPDVFVTFANPERRTPAENRGFARDFRRGYGVPPPKIAGSPVALRCRDRKSTRLNSSHSQISYAVFCLKKKK